MKKLRVRFKHTKFGPYLPVVPVAAAPRSNEESKEESKEGAAAAKAEAYGVETLINTILANIDLPNRENAKN